MFAKSTFGGPIHAERNITKVKLRTSIFFIIWTFGFSYPLFSYWVIANPNKYTRLSQQLAVLKGLSTVAYDQTLPTIFPTKLPTGRSELNSQPSNEGAFFRPAGREKAGMRAGETNRLE
jgi:hypothetical protein